MKLNGQLNFMNKYFVASDVLLISSIPAFFCALCTLVAEEIAFCYVVFTSDHLRAIVDHLPCVIQSMFTISL